MFIGFKYLLSPTCASHPNRRIARKIPKAPIIEAFGGSYSSNSRHHFVSFTLRHSWSTHRKNSNDPVAVLKRSKKNSYKLNLCSRIVNSSRTVSTSTRRVWSGWQRTGKQSSKGNDSLETLNSMFFPVAGWKRSRMGWFTIVAPPNHHQLLHHLQGKYIVGMKAVMRWWWYDDMIW